VTTGLLVNGWQVSGVWTGATYTTVISFAPVQAKFVRITQTATVEGAPPWSMQRLRLFAAPSTAKR
jgi:hypothetical protein